ncbi:MAG: SGNH/GDSL hydrolase family protein [Actinomycetota bacterium]|nr:SGNH/GDSL hydrolase family protein [Actinomycetota bacterium]
MRSDQRSKPFTYVAIGASDTVGIGADDPQTEGWPALVYERLPRGTRFLRLGVSGSTAEEAVRAQLPTARAASPDLVTVWLAVNDFNASVPRNEYLGHLDRIVGEMAATGARVFVANVPDLTGIPRYEGIEDHVLRGLISDWNAGIAEVVQRHGATLVDLWPSSQGLEDREELLSDEDHFHPSTLGHQVLAALFLEVMSRDTVVGSAIS